jgi:catechol 2,3-dioxygenase-like lactoylglutathione lyase family enzyme
MRIDTCHFEIRVHSLEAAKAFYVEVLGLEILQEAPAIRLLAVRAGAVRISIFADAAAADTEVASAAGGHVIFRTPSLARTIDRLRRAGIDVPEVSEAPGFMRYVALRDPSGNLVEIAEYLRDPLRTAVPVLDILEMSKPGTELRSSTRTTRRTG